MKHIAPGLAQADLWSTAKNWPPRDIDVVLLLTHESGEGTLPETGPKVIRFPILDNPFGVPSADFDALSDVCRNIADRKVLTVCYRGENRSGLASALILVHRGYSPEQAIRTVQSAGNTLWNQGFQLQLRGMKVAA